MTGPERASAPRPKATRQRAAIAQALSAASGFLSAQELHDQLRAAGHKLGLTTVYRTLQAFNETGVVDSMRREDGETIYRRCATEIHHHHLVCRSCGFTVEIENEEVERWTRRTADEHGFEDVTHDIQVFGLCRACSAGS